MNRSRLFFAIAFCAAIAFFACGVNAQDITPLADILGVNGVNSIDGEASVASQIDAAILAATSTGNATTGTTATAQANAARQGSGGTGLQCPTYRPSGANVCKPVVTKPVQVCCCPRPCVQWGNGGNGGGGGSGTGSFTNSGIIIIGDVTINITITTGDIFINSFNNFNGSNVTL